jgi:serine-type D-Ala-D-Ala carboxypeptidase/endopeptidase (penicillin-binding protein 4)
MKHLSRSAVYGAFVAMCLVPFNVSAQALPQEVLRALARAGVPSQSASVIVQPIATSAHGAADTALVRHQADLALNPASVMKLVTTYAALDQLGQDFTWKNRVYIEGSLAAGVLQGNLILRGSGDPKLVLERIQDLFLQIQAKGIREIRGNIVLDRSVFDVPARNPADFDAEPLRPYNASPDGFLVNFKSLIFTFTPDAASKRVFVRSEPPIAQVDLPLEVSASNGPCHDWRASLQADFSSPDRVSFAGRYPLACGERAWPVAYIAPHLYATRVIEAMWRQAGGQLDGMVREGTMPSGAQLWHTAESLPLSDIIADINKFSNNVMAQQLFLTLSSELPHTGKTGNFPASQLSVAAWWRKKFPAISPPVIENGSGLSRQERTTAAAINSLLQSAAKGTQAQAFANSLGIAGVDGTVARMRERNAGSAALGQAQLKTGSLKDVASIAGYATAQDGQRYSLVAIINHPNASAARPALDALVEWVVKRQESQARKAN